MDMDVRKIAKMAMDEDIGSYISQNDNGDGTSTFSVTFRFDPKVQAEMSKAMPKGQKRDDQPDLIPADEDEEPRGSDGEQQSEGVMSPGEKESDAEDAAPKSRHANTPLENCRAKDPMFCPYHGQKAIEDFVSKELAFRAPTIMTACQAKFNVSQDRGTFSVEITAPSAYNSQVLRGILGDLISRKGVVPVSPVATQYGSTMQNQSANVTFKASPDYDKVEMLHEWADDLMIDVSSDSVLQKELDPQEFADFLGKMEALDTANQIASNAGAIGVPSSTASKSLESSINDAQDAYHSLRGQADNLDVKTIGDLERARDRTGFDEEMGQLLYRSAWEEANKYKTALFGKLFPRGFAKQNEFAGKYTKASSTCGWWDRKDFDDADANAQTVIAKESGADIKDLRVAAGDLRYRSQKTLDDAEDFAARQAPEFIDGLYNWAVSNNHPNLLTAFPHGKPKYQHYGKPKDGSLIIDQTSGFPSVMPIGVTDYLSIDGLISETLNGFPKAAKNGVEITNMIFLKTLEGIASTEGHVSLYMCPLIERLDYFPKHASACILQNNDSLSSLSGLPEELDTLRITDCPSLKSLNGAPSKVSYMFIGSGTGLSQKQIDDYKDFLKNPDPAHMDSNGNYKE